MMRPGWGVFIGMMVLLSGSRRGPHHMHGPIRSGTRCGSSVSFYVSFDTGTEDIFDAPYIPPGNQWQWSVVSGRNSGAPLPRVFHLKRGLNRLVFRSRHAGSKLDAIVMTDDPALVPTDASFGRFDRRRLQPSSAMSGMCGQRTRKVPQLS